MPLGLTGCTNNRRWVWLKDLGREIVLLLGLEHILWMKGVARRGPLWAREAFDMICRAELVGKVTTRPPLFRSRSRCRFSLIRGVWPSFLFPVTPKLPLAPLSQTQLSKLITGRCMFNRNHDRGVGSASRKKGMQLRFDRLTFTRQSVGYVDNMEFR